MMPNRFSAIPLTVGPLHFIGIGGIGMSGLAEVLHHLGYTVQGSDMSDNANVARLRGMGVKVMTAHDPENVQGAGVVIVSSAVKDTNPEWIAARAARIPVIKRADMLAELARFRSTIAIAGTHGKTTTTTLVACLLDAAGLDPTMINGGIVNAYGTNARLGSGSWLVAEADESDGTFLRLNAEIAVVTNIDPEHLDYYGTESALHHAFHLWTLIGDAPRLAVLSVEDVAPHLPADGGSGAWQTVRVPFRAFEPAFAAPAFPR